MKRKILILAYLIIAVTVLMAQNIEGFILLKPTPLPFDYRYPLDEETYLPMLMAFLPNNKIIKVEANKNMLHIIESNLDSFISVFSKGCFFNPGGYTLYSTMQGNISFLCNSGLITLFFDDKYHVNFIPTPRESGQYWFCIGNLVVFETGNGLLGYAIEKASMINVDTMKDQETYDFGGTNIREMDTKATIAYIKNNASRFKGLSIDNEGNPLYFNVPLTSAGQDKYWGERFGSFIAMDKDHNTMYRDGNIRNKNGETIKTITMNHWDYGNYMLDTEGNLYILTTGRIAYLGRDWGFSNIRDGVVNNDSVRIRLHPGTYEYILDKANKGTPVKVLEESSFKETISGVTAPWYKVKLGNGLVGWIFGAFVDIKKNS